MELDSILNNLADFAAGGPGAPEFYRAAIAAMIAVPGIQGAAVWEVSGRSYRLAESQGLLEIGIEQDRSMQSAHEQGLDTACGYRSAGTVTSAPIAHDAHSANTSATLSPTKSFDTQAAIDAQVKVAGYADVNYRDYQFHFQSCRRGEIFLVLETVTLATVPVQPELHREFLAAMAETVEDYRRARLLDTYEDRQARLSELQRTTLRLHRTRSLDHAAAEFVNECRQFLRCDRVTLIRTDLSSPRTLAVSGAATFDRRSKQIRCLEELSNAVRRAGIELSVPTDIEQPPEIEDTLHRYVDLAKCEHLQLIPLTENLSPEDISLDLGRGSHASGSVLGVLAVEDFRPLGWTVESAERLALLRPHIVTAYSHAMERESLPLLGLAERLRKWRSLTTRHMGRIVLRTAALVALLVIPFLVPARLTIHAQGVYRPSGLNHLYAPADGEIIAIHAEHQSEVKAGDVLLVLRSKELELRKEELLTERGVAIEKLRSIEAARLNAKKSTSQDSTSRFELSAGERELKETVSSLDDQLQIVNAMQGELQVKSPRDGRVISWNPVSLVLNRPVQHGQKLMSIADLKGSGIAELRVEDTEIRHVIRALGNTDGIDCVFTVATEPGKRHHATARRIGTLVETENGLAAVKVEADVDPSTESVGIRPGATVYAELDCGSSNLGTNWLRRLSDFIQLRSIWIF